MNACPKDKLQYWAHKQKKGGEVPAYEVAPAPNGQAGFIARCRYLGMVYPGIPLPKRKLAEQSAAAHALWALSGLNAVFTQP